MDATDLLHERRDEEVAVIVAVRLVDRDVLGIPPLCLDGSLEVLGEKLALEVEIV